MFLLQQIDHTLKKIKSQSANLLTLFNLGLGGFAIIFVLQNHFQISLLFITFAAIFDRLDGMVARKLNITSELGKQLDSLSDIISFGVAPAMLLYQSVLFKFGFAGAIFTVIFIACGAFRLARFNITDSTGYFIGLPITAAGCLLTLCYLFIDFMPSYQFMFIIMLLSFLMISNIKMKKV